MRAREEMFCQCQVLRDLSGGDSDIALQLIEQLAVEMRAIINSYESKFDRVPSGEEIIWVMSERRKSDVREIVKNQK